MSFRLSLQRPNWQDMRPAIVLWLSIPALGVAAMLLTSWLWPDALVYFAWGPIAIPLIGYVYVPWMVSKLRIFSHHNMLKSLGVGVLAYELYRQALVTTYQAGGGSLGSPIREYCSGGVETFGSFIQCGAAAFFVAALMSAAVFLAPATLVAALQRRA